MKDATTAARALVTVDGFHDLMAEWGPHVDKVVIRGTDSGHLAITLDPAAARTLGMALLVAANVGDPVPQMPISTTDPAWSEGYCSGIEVLANQLRADGDPVDGPLSREQIAERAPWLFNGATR